MISGCPRSTDQWCSHADRDTRRFAGWSLTQMNVYSGTTRKTGYFEAIVSNASTGSCRSTGICGRPPGTLLTYCLITAARSSAGTSKSLAARARRCRRVAQPPAARTFRTQLHSPSIETTYHWPPTSAMPKGNRVTAPVRRPRTSSVTQRRGRRPRRNALFQNHVYRRVVALPAPAHVHRTQPVVLPFAPGRTSRTSVPFHPLRLITVWEPAR